jgi:hypothetical protein
MPNVVVAGCIIQCSHFGTLKLSAGDNRLSVNGAGAITFGKEAGLSFAFGAPGVVVACPCPSKAPPPSPPTIPCAQTLPATSGVSTLLTIAGAGVLLETATGQAVNPVDPSATWSIADAGQILLSADQ